MRCTAKADHLRNRCPGKRSCDYLDEATIQCAPRQGGGRELVTLAGPRCCRTPARRLSSRAPERDQSRRSVLRTRLPVAVDRHEVRTRTCNCLSSLSSSNRLPRYRFGPECSSSGPDLLADIEPRRLNGKLCQNIPAASSPQRRASIDFSPEHRSGPRLAVHAGRHCNQKHSDVANAAPGPPLIMHDISAGTKTAKPQRGGPCLRGDSSRIVMDWRSNAMLPPWAPGLVPGTLRSSGAPAFRRDGQLGDDELRGLPPPPAETGCRISPVAMAELTGSPHRRFLRARDLLDLQPLLADPAWIRLIEIQSHRHVLGTKSPPNHSLQTFKSVCMTG